MTTILGEASGRNAEEMTDDPYSRYGPLLVDALASLARTGFAVPPQDALDLIRDFLAEEWPKVRASYDAAHPSRARFETYLYAAFTRFARKRITRLRRWYGRLIDVSEIRELATQARGETEHDLALVRKAIAALPQQQRAVLLDYLAPESASERAVARSHGLTRYRLRETLVEAMGSIAVAMGERGRISKNDWDVILSLWRDGRDVGQTAAYLGTSSIEVQMARKRLFEMLAAPAGHERPKGRKETPMDEELASLIDQAAVAVGDEKLLAKLHRRAGDLGTHLQKVDTDDIPLQRLRDSLVGFLAKAEGNPAWIARVLDTFVDDTTERLAGEVREELTLIETREEQIAEAFELLVADLPPDLRLEPRLSGLPFASKEIGEAIREQPFMKAAGEVSLFLADRGMSPLTVFRAARAVPELAERIARFESAKGRNPFVLRSLETRVDDGQSVDPSVYIEEIRELAACPSDAARALYGWLFDVASVRQHVYFGYRAAAGKGVVRLAALDGEAPEAIYTWAGADPVLASSEGSQTA